MALMTDHQANKLTMDSDGTDDITKQTSCPWTVMALMTDHPANKLTMDSDGTDDRPPSKQVVHGQ